MAHTFLVNKITEKKNSLLTSDYARYLRTHIKLVLNGRQYNVMLRGKRQI